MTDSRKKFVESQSRKDVKKLRQDESAKRLVVSTGSNIEKRRRKLKGVM